MKKFLFCAWMLTSLISFAQPLQRPKLVVGIVVDQMRWDYLYRFHDRYGNDGFRRLLREGFSNENTMIPYVPTVTAAGHTTVYTGTVPALHGIIGNTWYDRQQKRTVYCSEDNTVQPVGTTSSAGKMSPRNLWSNTITDELRLATNFRSKTISIALKDRGSIFPGGHTSNGSYWFDNESAGWITSSFYMKELPEWVKQLNARKLPDLYLKQNWNTLYPLSSYTNSTSDSNNYEGKLEDGTFPHITNGIANGYEVFRTMPQANTYTFEMARAAIAGENLGGRSVTDFLAISFSPTDYIGHTFGPNSIEVEDTYLRFDKDLASFLQYLDKTIGKGQYLLFLTADHAVAHNPFFFQDHQLPAGSVNMSAVRRQIGDSLERKFGQRNLIENVVSSQVFLNDSLILQQGLNQKEIKKYITAFLMKQPGVLAVVDLNDLSTSLLPQKLKTMIINGYNHKLSGDLQVIVKPVWFENLRTGASHSNWNPYDAHIPLLWFGWKIKAGKSNRERYMTDIAATLAALLHIQMPNSSIGDVIEEVIK